MALMHLRSLSVVNFKNFGEVSAEFSPKLNTFIGDNGAGKTNLLDALYSLSFTKSFFNISDQMSVRHGESWFLLQGRYERDGLEEQVVYGFQEGQKKQMKRGGKQYRRMSEHIGLLPLVMVSPSDSVLVSGGSEERRKFLDGVISQYNPAYLDDLLRYNRILLQRNNYLKQVAAGAEKDADILAFYDTGLAESGHKLYGHRTEFVKELIPVFQQYYTTISGGNEEVGLIYQSDLHQNDLEPLLRNSSAADFSAQYTTRGVHKDDLVLNLGSFPLKRLGSQGQQKTYLVALKLAQFEFIRQVSGIKPILLLDDIFDKLDSSRVEKIVRIVAGEGFGQIFITDTNRDHLDSILHTVTSDYKIFKVTKGTLEVVR